jgi:two-component system OmpR family sensor kinase
MGRLFWKFLLSYWAALLFVVLGVAATAWLYQRAEGGPDLALATGPHATFVVDSAAATVRHGGLLALRGLLEDWRSHGDAQVFAVDGSGRELLGRPVPADVLSRARLLVETGGESNAARRVDLPDGQSYTLYIPFADQGVLPRLLLLGGPPPPWVPLVVGTIVSLAFGAALAWYVARPIRHLREAFAVLSEGHLETRVAPLMGRRRDEVADLGQHFDRMAQRLQKLMAAQRSLLHEVSHELRSPLARLQAATGLARQNPQKLETSLDRIEQEAERLDELVGHLLTLSRLEAGVRDASLERVESTDLVDLVASIAADARFEAESCGRTVVFSSQGETVADVHAELLHRAVENVVRNAVKYTRPGTVVEVTAGPEAEGGSFLVRVSDRGSGVADGELDAIFEPFFRSPEGPPGPGFGLGLAITRRAVEAHRGQVNARNRPGGGLQIEIRIPVAVSGLAPG